MTPTAAQRRVQVVCTEYVQSFLRGGASASGEAGISKYLRQPDTMYGRGHVAQPLGLRAGVPDTAGAVALSSELRPFDDAMAEQVDEPTSLLLPPDQRPAVLPRPHARLADTYAAFVKRNVRAGLQHLRPRKRIAKFRGRPLMNGAFAVFKDDDEDRAISALNPTNALIDKGRLWKPAFPMMPSLRCVMVRPGKRLRMHKRDGRHFPPAGDRQEVGEVPCSPGPAIPREGSWNGAGAPVRADGL